MLKSVRSRCWVPDRRGWVTAGLCLTALLSAAGCQQGYRWEVDIMRAEQRARDEGKVLFVFYQLWTDGASNRMKGYELLSDRQVEAEFRDTVNVLIDRDFGSMYVGYLRKYKVYSYPAFVLVSPDGKYYKPLTGGVARDQFLQWVRDFKARSGRTTRPADKSGGK